MNVKYIFTGEKKMFFGVELSQIKAVKDFGDVKAGDIGGYIEKINNLDMSGNAWVSENALVYGDSLVSGNSRVSGNAWVSENALVYGNSQVYGDSQVSGNSRVSGNAQVSGNSLVFWISKCGSSMRTITVYADSKINWRVNCGCFTGSIEEFEKSIDETHGDNNHGMAYRAMVCYIKSWIDIYGDSNK